MNTQLISPADVCERLTIGMATLSRIRKRDETFPKPYRLTGKRIGFSADELDAWLASRRESV